jgi:hypothetical protein
MAAANVAPSAIASDGFEEFARSSFTREMKMAFFFLRS